MNSTLAAGPGRETRAIVRRSRVLNYDLARWVSELRPQLQSKQQTLGLEVDDLLPAVPCDREQLRRVVATLVTSAHTFTDVGGSIIVAAYGDDEGVRIEVRDTGRRGGNVRTRTIEAFTRTIIEGHGGSISMQREPMGKTMVAFTIPTAGVRAVGRSAA